MDEIYKDYGICTQANEWGYYEATNLNDCDAYMKYAKSIEELKTEIDDKE